MVDPMENVHPYTQHDGFVLRGITLRTWVAAQIASGYRAGQPFTASSYMAEIAVKDADALIKELNK